MTLVLGETSSLELLAQLRADGVAVVAGPESHDSKKNRT